MDPVSDLLSRIEAALKLCPCGATPRPGSRTCSNDCEPDPQIAEPGAKTAMHWRPDLMSEDDTGRWAGIPGRWERIISTGFLPDNTRRALRDWLADNDIDPLDVPATARILITDDTITIPVAYRNAEGGYELDPEDRRTLLAETRTFPRLSQTIPDEVRTADFVHVTES